MSASEPRRGAYLERQAKKALEDNGYYVIKAAGSKGIADLVAVKRGQVLFVQAKLHGVMPPAERAALWDAAQRAGAVPVLVTRVWRSTLVWSRLVARDGPPLAVWAEFKLDEVA